MSHSSPYLPNSILESTFRIATVVLLIASASPAKADASQIKTEDFNYSLPFESLSSTGDFTLPSFDTSLGTLENIQLTLSISSTSKQLIYNLAGKLVGFKYVTNLVPGSIAGPGDVVLNTTNASPVSSNPILGGANPHTGSYTTNKTIFSESDPSVLSLWENQGNNFVDFSYDTGGSSFGHFVCLPGTYAGKTEVTVQYTYDVTTTATPEPSGKYLSAIVAAGMLFLAFGRRKRLRA